MLFDKLFKRYFLIKQAKMSAMTRQHELKIGTPVTPALKMPLCF